MLNFKTTEDILAVFETGLRNSQLFHKDSKNINVKKIEMINNDTILCNFYSENSNSYDVKLETIGILHSLHGFLKDGTFDKIKSKNYAARAYDEKDNEIMYALTSKENLSTHNNMLDKMSGIIFQENTKDFRLKIAKSKISEIENALREVITDRLSNKHGSNWFCISLRARSVENAKNIYHNKFGDYINDGNILINYTYFLDLKRIVLTKWTDFSDLFQDRIRFEESMVRLNEIRREEAHNREINDAYLKDLGEIYEFIFFNIAELYPNILPHSLIYNWRAQIRKIVFREFEGTYSNNEIELEKSDIVKSYKFLMRKYELDGYLKDIVFQLKQVITPIQKKKTHNEIIDVFKKYRSLNKKYVETCVKRPDEAKNELAELELYAQEVNVFLQKVLMEES